MNPMDKQVGGSHYKDFKVQPLEYALDNGLGICEHAVIKYISRWNKPTGGGLKDLQKAAHYIEILMEREEKANPYD
jgi:hypothetical protein